MRITLSDPIERKRILLSGIVGILGALLGMVADLGSAYAPSTIFITNNIYSISINQVAVLLIAKPYEQLVLGHYFAILFIPFGIFGVWGVYRGLRPDKNSLARVFFLLAAFAYIWGTVYHSALAFIATGLQAQAQLASTNEQARLVMAAMLERFISYQEPLGHLLVTMMILLSLFFMLVVWSRNTWYPRWMVMATPFTIQLVLGLLVTVLPQPLNQLIFVIAFNGSMFIFFVISILILSRTTIVFTDTPLNEKNAG